MKAMLQAAAMLAALFCAACSQSSTAVAPGNYVPTPPQQAAPADPLLTFGLPQLPSEDEVSDEAGAAHAVAIAGSYEIYSTPPFRRAEPALYSIHGQPTLVAGDFGPRWLMYRLSNVAADFFPSRIAVGSQLMSDSTLWVMVSDYSTGRWLPLGNLNRPKVVWQEPELVQEEWLLDDMLPTYETLASPGGNLYLLLALERGMASISRIQVQTEHEISFDAPTGLSYEIVGENRVRFSWDPYIEPRVQFIELHRRTYTPPQSSSRVTSQGGPGNPGDPGSSLVTTVSASEMSVEITHDPASNYRRFWIRARSDTYQLASPDSEPVIIAQLDDEE